MRTLVDAVAFEPTGQGWTQVAEFGTAFVLSAAIGLEREIKQKSAGLRTYTVVGLGAALFVLVSKYGFTDVLVPDQVVLDPSRVAAQIVSGLGFIGGGIIFVQRGSVRGLTTAASIWLTAAVGAAAGAGLPVLALLATAAYFVAILVLAPVAGFVRARFGAPWPTLRVRYLDGRGLLREIVSVVTESGFAIHDLTTVHRPPDRDLSDDLSDEALSDEHRSDDHHAEGASVVVTVELGGRGDVEHVVGTLAEIDGVLEVATGADAEP